MKLSHRRQFLQLAVGAAALPAAPRIAKAQTVANAPYVVHVGYPPFASPLSSLPNATPENYLTLNPNSAQGAMIDLYKAIANEADFQLQFLVFVARELPGAFVSHKIDTLYAVSSAANRAFMDFSEPIFADSEVLIANRSDTTPYDVCRFERADRGFTDRHNLRRRLEEEWVGGEELRHSAGTIQSCEYG